jgi:hypothetical protein
MRLVMKTAAREQSHSRQPIVCGTGEAMSATAAAGGAGIRCGDVRERIGEKAGALGASSP